MKNQTRMSAALMIILCAVSAQAGLVSQCDPHTFGWIWDSDASAVNGAIGEQQLSFTVSEVLAADEVIFKFMNTAEQACSLTGIYFESSLWTLEDILQLEGSDGVSFSKGAEPGNMPRWSKVDFEPTLEMTADSDSPAVSQNGIDLADEWLEITVATQASLEQICQELNDQSIRVGIHVQAFDDGGSEALITPEPASMALLAFGGLMLKRRRKI